MWAYTLATLRSALRSPLAWVLLLVGVFLGWFGTTLAVLALDSVGAQAEPLTVGTAHLVGVFLALWLVGRGLEEDRASGFAAAADVTPPGYAGRLAGRWAGSTLAGAALALVVAAMVAAVSAGPAPSAIYMLSTSIMVCAHAAAWGVLLGSLWRGGAATLAALLLWLLGHLPWGHEPFLEGLAGRAVGAWLPGPAVGGGWDALGYTSPAVAGLLLVALALGRPADA